MKFRQFIDKSVLMSFHDINRYYYLSLNQQLKDLNLNFYEALILLSIFFEDNGDIYPGDLEKALNLPKDQISQWITKLEDRNLIRRKIGTQDRRKKSLHLLAHGQKLSFQLIKVFDGQEQKIEEHTSSLTQDILKIANDLRQQHRP